MSLELAAAIAGAVAIAAMIELRRRWELYLERRFGSVVMPALEAAASQALGSLAGSAVLAVAIIGYAVALLITL